MRRWLFLIHKSVGAEQLGQQDGAAGGTAQGVVGQTHKLIIVLAVLAQTTQGYGHTTLQVAVQLGLGHIILLKILEELLGGGG